jgi:phosphoglycerol transferase MdoB-like AlkP superfamily enzyme
MRTLASLAQRARAALGRNWIAVEACAFFVVGFTLLRIALVATEVDLTGVRVRDIAAVFFLGLRFDLFVALCVVLPQLVHLTVYGFPYGQNRFSRWCLEIGWLIGFVALPFYAVAEFLFFTEFSSRLNYIAFEYLVYPTEVCCNIWQSYHTGWLLAGVATLGAGMYVWFRRRFAVLLVSEVPRRRQLAILATAVVCAAALWQTVSADSSVTANRPLNEAAGNGFYSFVNDAYTCRFDYTQYYALLDPAEAAARVRRRVGLPGDRFALSTANPLDRTVTAAGPQRDYNVVLILEESFGSEFVGVLGNKEGLTPNFDALCRDGLLLDRFYATGNRTARALEAVLTSLPPIPTESILKRDHSDRVYTLARVLEARGYERLFITAGRGLFDGVRTFMKANGFNRFVEQKDFQNPVFVNAWGVCDEDLFDRGLEELAALHRAGKPFFATFLTVSNHRPFTFPPGRIDESGDRREKGIQYADYALGRFFREVRKQPYFSNTLFVVMGDHGARVYGSQMFPMKSYRIPVLMFLPQGRSGGTRCHTLASSLDIAPTILGVLGGSYPSVFFGRDVLALGPAEGCALMQHNHDLALLGSDNRMIVLGSGRKVTEYRLDASTFALTLSGAPDTERASDTIALFQMADRLYYAEQHYPGLPAAPPAQLTKAGD